MPSLDVHTWLTIFMSTVSSLPFNATNELKNKYLEMLRQTNVRPHYKLIK